MDDFTRPAPIRHACSLLLWILAIAPTTGCTGNVERQWSEEVALDDGGVIVVDRYVKLREANSLAGDAYGSRELKSTISFRGELAALQPWDVPLQPLVLYRAPGVNEWALVATTSSCESWYARNSPNPPYWEFRLRGGKWLEVPLSVEAMNRKSNLFILYEHSFPTNRMTLVNKREAMTNVDVAHMYRNVTRNATWGCTAPVR